jgi:hypothetical protein
MAYVPEKPNVWRSIKEWGALGNGVADDSGAFVAACTTLAGTGVGLYIPQGTYIFAHPGTLTTALAKGPLSIKGSPETTLKSTMSFTGTQTNSIIFATAIATGQTGTLNGAAVQGNNQVSYTVVAGPAPVVGQTLQISGAGGAGNSAQCAIITSVGGVGPYTLMLDDDIQFPFQNGDPCTILSSQPTLRIYGDGMVFTGTGDRAIELVLALRCYIEDVSYNTSGGYMGDLAFAYDDGGRENEWNRVRVDWTGAVYDAVLSPISYGIVLEAQVRSTIRNSQSLNGPAGALGALDSSRCQIINSDGTTVGVHSSGNIDIGTDGAYGSFDIDVEGCSGNGGRFGFVANGVTRLRVTDCTFNGASVQGLLLNSGGVACNDITFTNVAAQNCGTGYSSIAGNANIKLINVDFSGASDHVLDTLSEINIDGIVATGLTNTTNMIRLLLGQARIRNATLQATAGAPNMIQCANLLSEFDNIRMAVNAGIGFYLSAGGAVATIDHAQVSGVALSQGINVAAGAIVRIGQRVDVDGCATPVSLAGGAYSNRGTVQLNNNVAVNVGFIDLKTTDTVKITLQTVAGASGNTFPAIVQTAGVGFSATGVANDTSTWAYEIS